jgi:hypothetical protein
MFSLLGNVLAYSSSAFGEAVAEDFEAQLDESVGDLLEEWFGSAEGDDGEYDNSEYEWTCDNGEVIAIWSVNNGWEDCADGSDEMDFYLQSYDASDDQGNPVYAYWGSIEPSALGMDDETVEADDWFYCSVEATSVPFQWVNNGEADCADGSDEYDATNPTVFDCDAGGPTISFEAVNDGTEDCSTGFDEGSAFYMMLDIWMDDGEGTMIMNANELMVCSHYSACDVYFSPGDNSMYITTDTPVSTSVGYGDFEQCIGAELYDAMGNFLVDMDMCETGWNGPSIDYVDVESNGYELDLWVESSDWNGQYNDVTLVVTLFDESESALNSWSVPYGGSSAADLEETYDVSSTGEYCLVAELFVDGETTPFDEKVTCGEVTEEPEPSDRLMAIAEAFADSGLEQVLEAFGENLEQTFTDVAENQETPEFPYVDGMWAPLWSTEHATIVGVGVYAWDEDDNGYVIAGPETTGYSGDLPMVFASIHYITGVPAQEAQAAMADINTLEDIVDVESHDLDSLAEALEEAGVDTSTLDITDSTDDNGDNGDDGEGTPSAEDIAEDAGLLPFMSPFALVAMIGLAVAFAQSGREEDE